MEVSLKKIKEPLICIVTLSDMMWGLPAAPHACVLNSAGITDDRILLIKRLEEELGSQMVV